MWRTRRWRKLLNVIDHLPRDSHYVEAQLDDEDLALLILAGPELAPRRRLTEWSPEVEVLAVIADRLSEVISVSLQAAGGSPPKFQPFLRPVTALDRVRVREGLRQHNDLVSRLLPRTD